MAGSSTLRPGHKDWDKLVSAAYLRMIGHTQAAAAKAVGRAARTLRRWESEVHTWSLARSEARRRWLSDAEDAARGAVLESIKRGNAELGFRLLERLDNALAPPRQRMEHTGADGGPIETHQLSDDELMKRLAATKNRLAQISTPSEN